MRTNNLLQNNSFWKVVFKVLTPVLRFAHNQLGLLFLLSIFILILGFFEYQGLIQHNKIFIKKDAPLGLDVSNHQGKIDWSRVKQEKKYSFVFIKATEGHDFIDPYFTDNWQEAKKNHFLVGAYHFFSVRSSGETQANLFTSVVPKEFDSLPPVLDLEINTGLERQKIQKEIKDFLENLEKNYEKTPIIYVTYETYNAYIKNTQELKKYSFWIRDIVTPPIFFQGNWKFWQFSNRERVPGINGFVDLNVFNGSIERLKEI